MVIYRHDEAAACGIRLCLLLELGPTLQHHQQYHAPAKPLPHIPHLAAVIDPTTCPCCGFCWCAAAGLGCWCWQCWRLIVQQHLIIQQLLALQMTYADQGTLARRSDEQAAVNKHGIPFHAQCGCVMLRLQEFKQADTDRQGKGHQVASAEHYTAQLVLELIPAGLLLCLLHLLLLCRA
jgi:hypothetical protein